VNTARRKYSASQEESLHQELNWLSLDLGLPGLQNYENKSLLFKSVFIRSLWD
jgi:hypothetical protein